MARKDDTTPNDRATRDAGGVGLADSPPSKHATGHALESGHAIVRSAEPGADWSWCFVDEVAFVVEPRGDEGSA